MVETAGLEPVTSCVWRNLPKMALNLYAAVGCGFWLSEICNMFCKWTPEAIELYRTKPLFMTRQPCDTALLCFWGICWVAWRVCCLSDYGANELPVSRKCGRKQKMGTRFWQYEIIIEINDVSRTMMKIHVLTFKENTVTLWDNALNSE